MLFPSREKRLLNFGAQGLTDFRVGIRHVMCDFWFPAKKIIGSKYLCVFLLLFFFSFSPFLSLLVHCPMDDAPLNVASES